MTIIARLRKCLLVSNDHRASEHERTAARRAADELMRRHGLTAADAWQHRSEREMLDEQWGRHAREAQARWEAEREAKREQQRLAAIARREREARARARREEKARRSAAWRARRAAAAERKAQKAAALRARLGAKEYARHCEQHAAAAQEHKVAQGVKRVQQRQREMERLLEQMLQQMRTIFSMPAATAEQQQARLQARWAFNKNLNSFLKRVQHSWW